MIAGLVKGLVKGIGKGLVKGAKFLGKGAKSIFKGLKKFGSKAKTAILEDASQKKDLGSKSKKFTRNILQENNIEQNRLSKSESEKELAQQFNLTPDERSYLQGLDQDQESQDTITKSEPVVHAEDPSIIDSVDYTDFEEIKDEVPTETTVTESKESEVVSTPSVNLPAQIKDTLQQHVYAGPPSLDHGYEVSTVGVSPVNPEELVVISEMIKEPLRLQIMAQLNRMYDVTTDIEIAGQKHQLAALNALNDKISNDRYLFLNQSLGFKNMLYDKSKDPNHSKRLDQIIAKYLVSKDGEVALTPELTSHLQILPQLTDDIAAIQAQVEELDSKQNKKEKLDAESQAEQMEQDAENSNKLDQATGILGTINGLINSVLDKVKLIPGPMEIIMLLFMAIDMIKDWWDSQNISLESIAHAIVSALRRWGVNIWDMITYWWKTVSIPGIKDSEGEFFWNGGDYYFIYNGKGKSGRAAGDVEKANWTESGDTQITRVWDSSGNLKSANITSGEGKGQGDSVGLVDNQYLKITVGKDKNYRFKGWKQGALTEDQETDVDQLESSHIFDPDLWDDMPTPSAYYSPTDKLVHVRPNYRLYGGTDDKEMVKDWGWMSFSVDKDGTVILKTASEGARKWFESTEWDRGLLQHKRGKRVHRAIELMVQQLYAAGGSGLTPVSQKEINEKWGGNLTTNTDGSINFSNSTSGTMTKAYSTRKAWSNSSLQSNESMLTDMFNNPQWGIKISDKFGSSRDGGRKHAGIDISAKEGGSSTINGEPIYAPIDGKVELHSIDGDLGGNRVWITTKDGKYRIGFMHLYEIDQNLRNGGTIEKGNPIGRVGGTGQKPNSYAPHLHLQIEKAPFGIENAVDPEPLIGSSYMKTFNPQLEGTGGDKGGYTFPALNNNWWKKFKWNGVQNPKSPLSPDVVLSTDFQPDASGNIQIQNREHNDYRNKGGNVCERSNNPGNIRGTGANSEVRTKYPGWVGITHSGSGDFSTFENQMWGIYAFYRLLATQYLPKGQNTIKTIFYKYCPPGDHGQNAPTQYIHHVAQQTGLGEDQVIEKPEKNLFQALMKSVYQFEGGTKHAPMAQEDLDEAWDIFDSHFKNQSWPVVATKEPEYYGTESDGSSYASNEPEKDLKSVLGDMMKDATFDSASGELVPQSVDQSHPDLVAEVDPNAKPLGNTDSNSNSNPRSNKNNEKDKKSENQSNNFVVHQHNYPANKKDYKINPDSYLHRQLNDA